MFGFITEFLLLFCCKLYPVFGSFKAIRRRDGDEYARWLMYWITFALFSTVTYFTDYVLWWFPLYEFLKLGIAIWLLPFFRGSKILYLGLVHPNLAENETQLEVFVNSISGRLLSLGRVLFSFALQKTTEVYATHTLGAAVGPMQQPVPPTQQPHMTPGMQYQPYPQPSTESYMPPSYSDVITTDQSEEGKKEDRREFSDDEFGDTSAKKDSDGQSSSTRADTSQPRMRDTSGHTQRPKSELALSQQRPVSRQKSPTGRPTRAQSEAEPERTSERRRTSNRQQTLEVARSSKQQEKI